MFKACWLDLHWSRFGTCELLSPNTKWVTNLHKNGLCNNKVKKGPFVFFTSKKCPDSSFLSGLSEPFSQWRLFGPSLLSHLPDLSENGLPLISAPAASLFEFCTAENREQDKNPNASPERKIK